MKVIATAKIIAARTRFLGLSVATGRRSAFLVWIRACNGSVLRYRDLEQRYGCRLRPRRAQLELRLTLVPTAGSVSERVEEGRVTGSDGRGRGKLGMNQT